MIQHIWIYIYVLGLILVAASFGWGFGVWCERTGLTSTIDDEHFSGYKTAAFFIFVLIALIGYIILDRYIK